MDNNVADLSMDPNFTHKSYYLVSGCFNRFRKFPEEYQAPAPQEEVASTTLASYLSSSEYNTYSNPVASTSKKYTTIDFSGQPQALPLNFNSCGSEGDLQQRCQLEANSIINEVFNECSRTRGSATKVQVESNEGHLKKDVVVEAIIPVAGSSRQTLRGMETVKPTGSSKLEELLTSDKTTYRSWRDRVIESSTSKATDKPDNNSVEKPVDNPRKRLLISAMKDSVEEKDVGIESEDKSSKGRKMMRWKTERRNNEATKTGAGEAASVIPTSSPSQKRQRLKAKNKKKLKSDKSAQRAHPLKVAPIILKKYYPSANQSASSAAVNEELLFSLSEDESVSQSSGKEGAAGQQEPEPGNVGSRQTMKNDDKEHMQAQIEKLLKMPSPPSKSWMKRPNSLKQQPPPPKFQCTQCTKLCHSEDDLERHTSIHFHVEADCEDDTSKGEKPYSCMHCVKTFTWLSSLRDHYMSWHEEISYAEKKRLIKEAEEKGSKTSTDVMPLDTTTTTTTTMDEKTELPPNPDNGKVSTDSKSRKGSEKSTPESTKVKSKHRPSRNRNISEEIIKRASKSISVEIGKPISSGSRKKSAENNIVVIEAACQNSGRASLRRNIQRPKWLTDADLVTDYEFPGGTNNKNRSGNILSSPSPPQAIQLPVPAAGAQTRSSQATAKATKSKKLEKAEKKKARAAVARNRVRTKSVDQVKVNIDSQATSEQSLEITTENVESSCADVPVVAAAAENEKSESVVVAQDNPSTSPLLSPDSNKVAEVIDEVASMGGISSDEITNNSSPTPILGMLMDHLDKAIVQPLTVEDNLNCKTIDSIDENISNDSQQQQQHSTTTTTTTEAPVLCKEMAFSTETLEVPETVPDMEINMEETQAPPVIDVFNSKSVDDEISSSSNQSTTLEAPVLLREPTNGIPEVPENIKEKDILEEPTVVEDIKSIVNDMTPVVCDPSASPPRSVPRKDSTLSSEIAEPPGSSETQGQDLEELPLSEEDDDGMAPTTRRRDRSDSLSMRSCGSGSQSEKIKGLEDTKEEEEEVEALSISKASDKDWAVDSDSNDSLMSEFSELAAQVSEKTDGVKFKEDCMRFISTKISANSMWAIRKELKRLKKEKNYFKFGKLSPLAACLMQDLFCQSLK